MQVFRSRWSKAAAAGLLASFLSTASLSADSFVRPGAKAACAALDLHLLWQIEDAASTPTADAEDLLATVEGLMRARRLCGDGKVAQAVETYDSLDLGISRVRWLQ